MHFSKFLNVIITVCIVLSTFGLTNAQQLGVYKNGNLEDNYNTLPYKTKPYQKQLKGDFYLFDTWMNANIYLTGDSIEIRNTVFNIDLQSKLLEIKMGDEVKLIPSYLVKSIELNGVDSEYTSRTGINLYGPAGFYRVIEAENVELYCYYRIRIEKAHYNPAIDTGEKDDIIKKEKDYYIKDGDTLLKLDTHKKKLIEMLGGSDALKAYIKKEHLNPKNEEDLVKILAFANKEKA